MRQKSLNKVVLSVGGSLIYTSEGINVPFLKNLSEFIHVQLKNNESVQYFLVIGGGGISRQYMKASKEISSDLTNEDLDWLGIRAARLNAHLVHTILKDVAEKDIITNYSIIKKINNRVVIASAWKPGWSTDYCATLLCEMYGINTVINLSNIEQVYTSDPKIDKNAKPISKISWRNFRRLVGDTWTPGLNVPFDPIASKKAQDMKLVTVVLSGNNFDNFSNYINGGEFLGTVIG